MTIRELIERLNAVPEERKEGVVMIYVDGTISGYLDLDHFHLDEDDEEYSCLVSARLREVAK